MLRTTNACDICVLRRVKCDEQRPCRECRKRCLECTTQRTRRKRGPKGPRSATVDRIRRLQTQTPQPDSTDTKSNQLLSPRDDQSDVSPPADSVSEDGSSKGSLLVGSSVNVPLQLYAPMLLPIQAYTQFMHIFRDRLYAIWPVVNISQLIINISNQQDDYESLALSSALCAATIAQLRLHDNDESSEAKTASSHRFALDAQHYRNMFDYREKLTVSTLLTSFFLHIYYANSTKLMTAGLFLRESICYAQALGLDRPELQTACTADEQSLRLRVYWLLFVSER